MACCARAASSHAAAPPMSVMKSRRLMSSMAFARTISEACDYMTDMGRKRELRQHWQRACQLILAHADVFAVSRALELALFMDAKLDVSKVPAKMKIPRTHLATEARHHFIAADLQFCCPA